MRQSGEELVSKIGITKGMKVLDLGCGDGTTAIPEAKKGAEVLGVDIASNLVAAGNNRVKNEGLTNCMFQLGDATNLSELQDKTFDRVVSIFGAMFAPKPFDGPKEMVRGTPVIYMDYTDYDEIAHHSGPERPESLDAIDGGCLAVDVREPCVDLQFVIAVSQTYQRVAADGERCARWQRTEQGLVGQSRVPRPGPHRRQTRESASEGVSCLPERP